MGNGRVNYNGPSDAPMVIPAPSGRNATVFAQVLGPVLGSVVAKNGVEHFYTLRDSQKVVREERINDLFNLVNEFVKRI